MSFSKRPPARFPEPVARSKETLRLAHVATLSHDDIGTLNLDVATRLDGAPLTVLAEGPAAILATKPGCDLIFADGLTLTCRAGADTSVEARARWEARHGTAWGPLLAFAIDHAKQDGALVDPETLCSAGLAFAALERRAVDHMNDDHLDAIAHYAETLLGAPRAGWRMASLDLDGLDLVARDLADGEAFRRLWFDPPLSGPAEIRPRLVDLAKLQRG